MKKSGVIVRTVVLVIVVSYVVWAYFLGTFSYIAQNKTQVVFLTERHLQLAGVASILAILFSIPAGILVTRPRFKKLSLIFTNVANIGQTVPGLAVMALAMTYMGIGVNTAIFAIWIYSLLPILRNTMSGLESVSQSVIDAGIGMGMTPGQIFWKLEFPNALRTILAGIRTSVVINIGTAALASLIGAGGLGDLIFMGISLDDTGTMLAGAIPVTFLAFVIDFVLARLEKVAIPKGLRKMQATI